MEWKAYKKKKLHKVDFPVPPTLRSERNEYKGDERKSSQNKITDKMIKLCGQTKRHPTLSNAVLKKRRPFLPIHFYWRVPLELKTARASHCVRCNNGKRMYNIDGGSFHFVAAAAGARCCCCRCCCFLQFGLPKDVRLNEWKWKMLNALVISLNWHINWWLYVFPLNLNSFFIHHWQLAITMLLKSAELGQSECEKKAYTRASTESINI